MAVSQMPGWVGPILVIVLGLTLLGAFVGRLLFTPFEEAVLVTEGRTLREPPPPERYRMGGRLLRFGAAAEQVREGAEQVGGASPRAAADRSR